MTMTDRGLRTPVRVGIADDEPQIVLALESLLATDPSLDLVGSACDADGAVALARTAHPDVMLLDVRMPGGGPQAAADIRAVAPATSIVAFTAYEDRATLLDMLRAGVSGYVRKGTSGQTILDAIHRAAEGGGTLSPEASAEIVHELGARLRSQHLEDEDHRMRLDRIRHVLAHPELVRIVYQPVFDLVSRQVVSMEALARFPDAHLRTPDLWFAEAAGLNLGPDLEVATAARALDALARTDDALMIGINVSPDTLLDPRFAELCTAACGDRSLDRVIIELTEHAPVDDYAALGTALDHLRERGAQVAIDDAGAGFASLRHILRLNPNIVKLDIDLTRGIDADRGTRALARALISFADDMGFGIVAEGVETDAQLEALRELGVRFAQGFLLGRPAPLPGD